MLPSHLIFQFQPRADESTQMAASAGKGGAFSPGQLVFGKCLRIFLPQAFLKTLLVAREFLVADSFQTFLEKLGKPLALNQSHRCVWIWNFRT